MRRESSPDVWLDSLTSIGSSFTLSYDTALTSLDGLENLNTVGGTFTMSYLNALTDMTALSSLTSAISPDVERNPVLTTLDGIGALDLSEGGYLTVYTNTLLTDISDLSGVSGWITNLDGLDNITEVGWTTSGSTSTALYIYGNAALTNLGGLYGITALDYGKHYMSNNSTLCTSAASALYSNIGAANILGTWPATSNKSGC